MGSRESDPKDGLGDGSEREAPASDPSDQTALAASGSSEEKLPDVKSEEEKLPGSEPSEVKLPQPKSDGKLPDIQPAQMPAAPALDEGKTADHKAEEGKVSGTRLTNNGGANHGDEDATPTVSLDTLADEAFPEKNAKELEPLQKIGFWLAIAVFALICTSTALIFVISFGFTDRPHPPGTLYYFDEGSVGRYQRAVDLYKQIGDVPLQRAKELFQLVVITAFLPSFTAILGYIFGSRGGNAKSDN